MSDAAVEKGSPAELSTTTSPSDRRGPAEDANNLTPTVGEDGAGEVDRLRVELDQARSRVLGAVDAAKGAEAERAAIESRVRELEHQHHMLKVERDELRREVERLKRSAGPARAVKARLRRFLRRGVVG